MKKISNWANISSLNTFKVNKASEKLIEKSNNISKINWLKAIKADNFNGWRKWNKPTSRDEFDDKRQSERAILNTRKRTRRNHQFSALTPAGSLNTAHNAEVKNSNSEISKEIKESRNNKNIKKATNTSYAIEKANTNKFKKLLETNNFEKNISDNPPQKLEILSPLTNITEAEYVKKTKHKATYLNSDSRKISYTEKPINFQSNDTRTLEIESNIWRYLTDRAKILADKVMQIYWSQDERDYEKLRYITLDNCETFDINSPIERIRANYELNNFIYRWNNWAEDCLVNANNDPNPVSWWSWVCKLHLEEGILVDDDWIIRDFDFYTDAEAEQHHQEFIEKYGWDKELDENKLKRKIDVKSNDKVKTTAKNITSNLVKNVVDCWKNIYDMANRLVEQFKKRLQLARNFSINTVENYIRTITQLNDFIIRRTHWERGVGNVKEITAYDVDLFVSDQREQGIWARTCNNKLSAIKTFLRFCWVKGERAQISKDDFFYAKEERRKIEALTEEECMRLLETARNDTKKNRITRMRDYCMVLVLMYTWIRVSELCNLKVSDLKEALTIFWKGRKYRNVYLFWKHLNTLWQFVKLCRDYRLNSDYIFFSTSNNSKGSKLNRATVEAVVKKLWERAGLDSPVFPHKLRHTFATQLLKKGVDLMKIKELMWHSSILTTQTYLSLENEELKEAQGCLQDFELDTNAFWWVEYQTIAWFIKEKPNLYSLWNNNSMNMFANVPNNWLAWIC